MQLLKSKPELLMFKKIVIILGLLFVATTNFAQQGWFWQNPLPQGNSLNSIYFVDENTGWVAGAYGTILHTTDSGANWNPQSSGTLWNLYSVFFADANNGWTAGLTGIILHTTDGGGSWNPQDSLGISDWLSSLYFINADTGWVVGR
jgi:photosystem II stability/assembly factor-like uncharacterized protein